MALQTCYKCGKQFPSSEISRIKITKKTGRIGKQVGLEHNLKTRQKTVKIESARNVYTDYEVLSCKNCKPINIFYWIFIGWWFWIYASLFKIIYRLTKKLIPLLKWFFLWPVLIPLKLVKKISSLSKEKLKKKK